MKLFYSLAFIPFAIPSPYPGYSSASPSQEVISSSSSGSQEYNSPSPGSAEYPVGVRQQSDTLAGISSTYSGYKGPGVYYIRCHMSGTYVDLYAGSEKDGAKIAGWEYSATSNNQRWHIVEAGDNTVMLINNGTGTLAAATGPTASVVGRISPPYSLHLRWKMDDQAYRNLDGYPTRFINQGNCEAMNLWNGEAHGVLRTWPANTKWLQQAFYLQLVQDARSPCSKCS